MLTIIIICDVDNGGVRLVTQKGPPNGAISEHVVRLSAVVAVHYLYFELILKIGVFVIKMARNFKAPRQQLWLSEMDQIKSVY